jgi:hypothetical protein
MHSQPPRHTSLPFLCQLAAHPPASSCWASSVTSRLSGFKSACNTRAAGRAGRSGAQPRHSGQFQWPAGRRRVSPPAPWAPALPPINHTISRRCWRPITHHAPACSWPRMRSSSAVKYMATPSGGVCRAGQWAGKETNVPGGGMGRLGALPVCPPCVAPAASLQSNHCQTTAPIHSSQPAGQSPHPHLLLRQVSIHQVLQAALGPQRRHQHAAPPAQQQGRGVDEVAASLSRHPPRQSLADVPAASGWVRLGGLGGWGVGGAWVGGWVGKGLGG